MGQWVGQCVNGWVSGSVSRFMICRDTPTYGWVVGWVSGSMGEVRSND